MASTDAATARIARMLGYTFRDPDLLARALTHRSAGAPHNERLEFLGDGLINFMVGLILYEKHPAAAEGDLTQARIRLVREEALAKLAEGLDLGRLLSLGGGERSSGVFRRASVLADALEALLGAVYLDGGLPAARAACERLYGGAFDELPDRAEMQDPKSRLQEYLQKRGRPLPRYEIADASGPSHQPAFTVRCRLADGAEASEGHAPTRQAAEQAAAARMLEQLGGARA